jgi:hypothetical protein
VGDYRTQIPTGAWNRDPGTETQAFFIGHSVRLMLCWPSGQVGRKTGLLDQRDVWYNLTKGWSRNCQQ